MTVIFGLIVIASITMVIVRWLRPSRPLVEVMSAVNLDRAHAGIIMTAGIRTRTLDEAMHADIQVPDDALELVRMDDAGGWQMAPAPMAGHEAAIVVEPAAELAAGVPH